MKDLQGRYESVLIAAVIDKDCLSFWLPILEQSGVPTPKTEIIQTGLTSGDILDCEPTPEALDLFQRIGEAGDQLGWPCFLRTGHGSGKHQWRDTCYLPGKTSIPHHVYALVEWSECVDMMGLPVRVWAVREMLRTKPYFTAFDGMPVVPELRCFVSGGELVASVPYWPRDCFSWGVSCKDWEKRLDRMNREINIHRSGADHLAIRVAEAFANERAWSVDVLMTERGWYVTDMALAAHSWGCPQELRDERRQPEADLQSRLDLGHPLLNPGAEEAPP